MAPIWLDSSYKNAKFWRHTATFVYNSYILVDQSVAIEVFLIKKNQCELLCLYLHHLNIFTKKMISLSQSILTTLFPVLLVSTLVNTVPVMDMGADSTDIGDYSPSTSMFTSSANNNLIKSLLSAHNRLLHEHNILF